MGITHELIPRPENESRDPSSHSQPCQAHAHAHRLRSLLVPVDDAPTNVWFAQFTSLIHLSQQQQTPHCTPSFSFPARVITTSPFHAQQQSCYLSIFRPSLIPPFPAHFDSPASPSSDHKVHPIDWDTPFLLSLLRALRLACTTRTHGHIRFRLQRTRTHGRFFLATRLSTEEAPSAHTTHTAVCHRRSPHSQTALTIPTC